MRRILMIAGLLAILIAHPAHAQPLDQRFEDLARRVTTGIGGFTGSVAPLKGPISLAYGTVISRKHRFSTLISTGGALVRITVQAALARHATAAGLFMSSTVLDELSVEHLIAADGVTITHEALPEGTRVMVSTDRRGAIRDALIVPPDRAPTTAVPQPGSRGFLEAISRFPLPVLVRENAVQDSDIFLPVTYPLGASKGFQLNRGSGPRVRGEVDCKFGKCLLVEVDEETQFTGPDRTIRAKAVGHMVVDARSVDVVSGFLNLWTEVRERDRTQVIRSIVTNMPTN